MLWRPVSPRPACGRARGSPEGSDMLKRTRRFGVLASVGVLTACATQPPPQPNAPGFLTGLFHGLTALFSLLASIFLPLRPYAFPNAGFWYDAGFSIGFSASVVVLLSACIARIGGFVTRGH